MRVEWVGAEPLAWLLDTAGAGTGLYLHDAADEDAVAELTEQVQEAAMEALWYPWPQCSLHPNSHPLSVGDEAGLSWKCPKNGSRIAALGELPAQG